MRHKLFSASCMVAIAVMSAAPAYADKGGPSNACGFSDPLDSALPAQLTPGNSATSPGSTHNEALTTSLTGAVVGNSLNGGKGGLAYGTNARQTAGAPSQYYNSCANVTAHSTNPNGMSTGAGTAAATTATGAPILQTATNNAQATRTISHTGAGK